MFALIPLILIFVSGLVLLLFLLFNFFNHVEPEQVDLNFIRQKNLYLVHILRILESPDYKFLSQNNRKYRDYLFVSYAKNLNQDMEELKGVPLSVAAYLYYLFFKVFYALLILKNKLYSSAHDLRVLVGIELMLVKKVSA